MVLVASMHDQVSCGFGPAVRFALIAAFGIQLGESIGNKMPIVAGIVCADTIECGSVFRDVIHPVNERSAMNWV